MASEVGIVNRGLILLGESTIASLDDESKPARLAKAIWPELRDDVLRSHPWNSAKRRAQLAALSSTPVFGWAFEYQWPATALRILRVNDADWSARVGWEVEGRKILTDWAAPIDVEYIDQVTDANEYDAQLRTALAFRVAAELAEPLTQQPAKRDAMLIAYQRAKIEGQITDGLEEDAIEDDLDDSWVAARYQ